MIGLGRMGANMARRLLAGDVSRTPGRENIGATAERGYLHCGPNGAGHFVKMVHNGIEYGVMAAYAEGLGVLRGASIGKRARAIDAETTPLRTPERYQYDLDLRDIAEVGTRGGGAPRFQRRPDPPDRRVRSVPPGSADGPTV
jgi:6-phosphogluconate dehydrogenase (decarboxylating)